MLARRAVNPAVRTARARRDPTVSYVPAQARPRCQADTVSAVMSYIARKRLCAAAAGQLTHRGTSRQSGAHRRASRSHRASPGPVEAVVEEPGRLINRMAPQMTWRLTRQGQRSMSSASCSRWPRSLCDASTHLADRSRIRGQISNCKSRLLASRAMTGRALRTVILRVRPAINLGGKARRMKSKLIFVWGVSALR